MTAPNISHQRLLNQHVNGNESNSVRSLVQWMGAIQAQDYNMAKYAIGVRLKNSTDTGIEEAINNGEIIRTHVLRPTWHFVAAEDARWMMELTAKNLHKALASNNKKLELDEKTFRKANGIIERTLHDGKHLTRKEIMAALEKKGIKTNELRASHLMFRAETDLIVCNGIKKEKQFTYALLKERVPSSKSLTKEEALAELALRYFTSHGPATIQDFAWWSGLSVTDSKNGLESIKSKLAFEKYKGDLYWFTAEQTFSKITKMIFLPAFDEFLISYKSRHISLDTYHAPRTFTNNGIFNPIIVHNELVVGTWKPQHKKEIVITPNFFNEPTEKQIRLCEKAAKEFGQFMQKQTKLMLE